MITFFRKQFLLLYFGLLNSIQFKDFRILFSCVCTHRLPKTTHLPHPIGIVIGRPPGTKIGENCTIFQNVTIGVRALGGKQGPKVGNDVTIFSGAVISGDVKIGHGASIGANAVVLDDVPEGAFAAGVPARIMSNKEISP